MSNWYDEARKRCDAATPRPWGWKSAGINEAKGQVWAPKDGCFWSAFIDSYSGDAEFIASARTDLPRALDEIKELREVLENALNLLNRSNAMIGATQVIDEINSVLSKWDERRGGE